MKKNQFMSILFWPYMQKTDDSGKAPIYCRITLDGLPGTFSIAQYTMKSSKILIWGIFIFTISRFETLFVTFWFTGASPKK